MKQFRPIIAFALIVLMLLGSVEASAKKRGSQRKQATTEADVTRLTTQDVFDLFSLYFNVPPSQFPVEGSSGIALESASYSKKCVKFVLSFSDDYFDGYDIIPSIADYIAKSTAVTIIEDMSIPINTFARTGISFELTIKDSEGNVHCQATASNSDIVQYYKHPTEPEINVDELEYIFKV